MTRKLKKGLALALALALVMAATSCGSQTSTSQNQGGGSSAAQSEGSSGSQGEQAGDGEVYTITLGSAVAVEHPQNQAAEMIQQICEERSGGRLKVEWYPAEQLGAEATMIENLQLGLQDAMLGSSEIYANYCADFNILGMAFAFESAEHVQKFFQSDVFQTSLDKLSNEYNIKIISLGFQKNPRAFFGKKPIEVPEDLEGVKFRVPSIPIWEKNFRQLGAIPVVVSWSEYPFALLQGVVDAGEATYESIYSMKLHEACPYISLLDYAYPVEALAMSQQKWDSLPEDLQQIFQEAVDEAAAWYSDKIVEDWEVDKQKIIDEGGEFLVPDKTPWIEKMAPLADELEAEGYWDTPGLYELVQEMK